MADVSAELVARWRAGDARAADELFRRYAAHLVRLARSRLPAQLARRVDPEDVVQSVYRSFFAGARDGRYDVQHGGDLWRLLVTITLHKLYHQVQRNARQKRTLDREQPPGHDADLRDIQAHLQTHQPTPLEAVALVDELEQLMRRLEPLPRRVCELRLQGYNQDEIAAAVGCSQRTVRRALQQIKQQLERGREAGTDP